MYKSVGISRQPRNAKSSAEGKLKPRY